MSRKKDTRQPLPVPKATTDVAQVLDSLAACVAYIDRSLHLRFLNKACADWLGSTVDALTGKHISELVDKAHLDCIYPLIQRALAGNAQHYEGTIGRIPGRQETVIASLTRHPGPVGGTEGVFVLVELRALPRHLQHRKRTPDNRRDGASNDRNHDLVRANVMLQKEVAAHRRAEALLDAEKQTMEMICAGMNLQSVLEKLCESIERFSQGGRCSILIANKTSHQLLRDVTSSLPASFAKAIREIPLNPDAEQHGPVAFLNQQVYVEDVASDPKWANYRQVALAHDIRSVWLMPILSAKSEVFGTLVLYYRVPQPAPQSDLVLIRRTSHLAAMALEHDLAARELNYLATHDTLTGLPNRHMFQLALDRVVAKARRTGSIFALMFIDLDCFKQVNDRFGHESGDALLRRVAERLAGCVRQQDMIARLGGDEFTLIIEDVKDVHDIDRIAEKLRTAFSAPFAAGMQELEISCSIGIAIYPRHGVDGESLVKNADAAMYQAKSAGRDSFRTYA